MQPGTRQQPWSLVLAMVVAVSCEDGSQDPDVDGDACGDECALTGSSTTGPMSTGPTPPPGTSTSGSSTGMDTGTQTGMDTTAGPDTMCTCQISDDDKEALGCSYETLPQYVPGCPEAMPCDRVTVECPRPGQDLYDCMGQELVYDEAALQCALETLRDQVPARLEIDGTEGGSIFSGQDIFVVHVLGPTAVVSGCRATDVGIYDYGSNDVVLADPSDFDACLALPTPVERYDCMLAGLAGDTEIPVCE